ncbi:hypothetical protein H2198_003799 [Neophaeococcomyces mojaviensis]|uniref:Uncharacterized protein n=1 Tax=Neophaeococcomyces mojaviensis TaxID=3383035 RepID=A0ACC3AAJ6_9EURO|nr:hypothetical protein H2198_003799 [Knufia sp. JES_112]
MRSSLIRFSRAPNPRPVLTTASRPPPKRLPPRSPIRPTKSSSPEVDAEVTSTLIRKRKPIVYAVGFAVVTVAGAIFGAQIKNVKQESEKRRQIEAAAEELSAAPAAATVLQLQDRPTPSADEQTLQPQYSQNQHTPYTVDTARQISLLEDRKALLKRQRMNLERKIEKLKERKARKEEMEARRAGGVKGQR